MAFPKASGRRGLGAPLIARTFALVALFAVACLAPASARAEPGWIEWHTGPAICGGNCAITGYAGRFVGTPMVDAFGTRNFVPIWDWQYRDDFIVAGAISRRLVTIGRALDLEGEIGVGQRFGTIHETEGWAAIFLRWTLFPWNHYLFTTAAVSTGLNYASGIPQVEVRRSGNNEGSKLLHFLSPELTFAMPDRRQWELVFRFHHRSGGRNILPENDLFNNSSGGSQFATVGVRYRF